MVIEKTNFDEFREIISYQEKIAGARVMEKGGNPATISQIELTALLGQPEEDIIEMRRDPLFGQYSLHTSLISKKRALRPRVIKPADDNNSKEEKACDFCRPSVYLKTAVPKIYHGSGEHKVITIPNMFPYISPHFVTIFSNDHKPKLEDVNEQDMVNYLSSGREIAQKLKADGLDGMWDFINWGPLAGGSQPHKHAQRGGLYPIMKTLMDKENEALQKRKIELSDDDPFENYINLARNNSLRIYEDENIFVFAPYAPRFTYQVDILTKKKNKVISNYLELDDQTLNSVSKNLAEIIKKLSSECKVTDLNVETHQARFIGSEDYRLHWHVYPRKGVIAGMELNDINILSAYPEDTAKAIRITPEELPVMGRPRENSHDYCGNCSVRWGGAAGDPCSDCGLRP